MEPRSIDRSAQDAPRIYLDTAVIARIADGDVDTNQLTELHRSMSDIGAVLALSIAHFWDAANRTDDETRRRFARVVDQFPRWGLIARSAAAEESARLRAVCSGVARPLGDPIDIEIRHYDLADAVWRDPVMVNQLTTLSETSARWNDAETAGRAATQSGPKLPAEQIAMGEQMMFAMLREAETIDDAIEWMRTRGVTDEGALSAMRQNLGPVWGAMKPLVAQHLEQFAASGKPVGTWSRLANNAPEMTLLEDLPLVTKGGLEAVKRHAQQVAPGVALRVALAAAKGRDVSRAPRESDLADTFHIPNVPYVDVATVDNANYAAIMPTLAKCSTPRPVKLLRNPGRDLGPVLDAVRSLRA